MGYQIMSSSFRHPGIQTPSRPLGSYFGFLAGQIPISENAINDDANPPNPLKIATICGIEVIWTFLANIRPIMPPKMIPEDYPLGF